jgi:hypothetical protein
VKQDSRAVVVRSLALGGVVLVAASCAAGPAQHREVAGSPAPTPPLPAVSQEAPAWRPPATTTTTAQVVRASRRQIQQRPVERITPQGDIWWQLALCESGGRQDAYNPAGPYYSYFQWSMPTWRAAGGEGDPRTASYETQRALAIAWQARTSWAQWPACSRKLGLR